MHVGCEFMYVCLRFLVCLTCRHVGWNVKGLIELQRSLIEHFWLVKLQFKLITQSNYFCPFRPPPP